MENKTIHELKRIFRNNENPKNERRDACLELRKRYEKQAEEAKRRLREWCKGERI